MPHPTYLLVHGSWHGPWCWEPLQRELDARGARHATVALPSCGSSPLGDLRADAEAVEATATGLGGEVIVVGHSYGGAVISEMRPVPSIGRLVFLCAFMPDTGRSYVSYLPPGDLPPFVVVNDNGTFDFRRSLAPSLLYPDCSESVSSWATHQLCPQSSAVMAHETTDACWRHVPSTYVICEEDQILPLPAQEMFAAQADSVLRIPSSHSPMLSRPAELAELLLTVE